MRDCIFLVADEGISAMLKGFLNRDQFHRSLQCGFFDFDNNSDVLVDANRDPGVFTRGYTLLAPYASTHRRAVVILDAEWQGAPPAEEIAAKIVADLQPTWASHLVVVIEPELEAWIWQDNVHVAKEMGVDDFSTLRGELEQRGFWIEGEAKPRHPKEAVEYALRKARRPRSNAIYESIASRVSTKHCVDPAFGRLQAGLAAWFEAEA